MKVAAQQLRGWNHPHRWTWLAVGCSVAICLAVGWLELAQRRTLRESIDILEQVRTARIELVEGFLHLTLGGEPGGAFDRGRGLAELRQAMDSLVAASAGRVSDNATAAASTETAVDGLDGAISRWRASPRPDPGIAAELRVAFHQLEREADRLDAEAQHTLASLLTAGDRRLAFVMAVAAGLLSVVCGGIYLAGQSQSRALRALAASGVQLRQLGDNLPDSYVFTFRRRGGVPRFLHISAGVERIHGVPPEAALADATRLFELIEPDQVELMTQAEETSRSLLTDFGVELQMRHRDGRRQIVQLRSHPERDQDGDVVWYGVATDVTALRRAAASLRERDQLLRDMSSMAHIGGWRFDPATGEGSWTDEIARIHDMEPGEATSAEVGLSVYHGEHRRRIEQAIGRAIELGEPYDLELEMVTRSGRTKWVRTIGVPVLRDGKVVLLRGAMQEITDRVRAERTSQRQAAEIATIFRASPAAIFYGSLADQRIIDINDRCLSLLGYTREEVIGRTTDEVRLWYDPGVAREVVSQVEAGALVRDREVRLRTKDGQVRTAELSLEVLELAGQQVGIVMLVDITRRRQLEEGLLRTQRLEAVGTLAGGIAHDLNNILAPILMLPELLADKLSAPRDKERLAMIGQAARRGAEIIRQLLTFSRGVPGDPGTVQLRHLLRELESMMRETLPRHIAIEVLVPPDLVAVEGDATQLHQVFLNLCVNARDAMPAGGRLSISARNHELTADAPEIDPAALRGSWVAVAVTDNGSGIAPEHLGRVFEPFFTTKPVGEGTGLGLSTVLGIVKSHRGFLQVSSEPGRGTTFEVFLPASTRRTVSAPVVAATSPAGAGELVLVVDDEAALREVVSIALEAAGYRALTAASGSEALAKLAVAGPQVKVLVTDVMMPDMGGVELVQRLRRLFPALPVIAATGLQEDTTAARLCSLGVHAILGKPFRRDALLAAVAGAIALPFEPGRHGGPAS